MDIEYELDGFPVLVQGSGTRYYAVSNRGSWADNLYLHRTEGWRHPVGSVGGFYWEREALLEAIKASCDPTDPPLKPTGVHFPLW